VTCIAAVIDGRRVHMGADSAISFGNERMTDKWPKLIRLGTIGVGCSGSSEYGQVVQLLTKWPTPPRDPKLLDTWARTDVYRAIKTALKSHEVEADSGDTLLAVAGRIYYLDGTASVHQPDTAYYAIGSGGAIALGSLHSSASRRLSPRGRLKEALEAAELHADGVRRPWRWLTV
jgi:ATP-dependent protease HslVU (ClpYQ) peptidase subunit